MSLCDGNLWWWTGTGKWNGSGMLFLIEMNIPIFFSYFIISFGRSTGDVWFGLSLANLASDYVFVDGTVITPGAYADAYRTDPWGSSEPTRSSSELCIRLRHEGFAVFRWADYGCGSQFNYLCKGMVLNILECWIK